MRRGVVFCFMLTTKLLPFFFLCFVHMARFSYVVLGGGQRDRYSQVWIFVVNFPILQIIREFKKKKTVDKMMLASSLTYTDPSTNFHKRNKDIPTTKGRSLFVGTVLTCYPCEIRPNLLNNMIISTAQGV